MELSLVLKKGIKFFVIKDRLWVIRASLVAQTVKHLPAMQETRVRFLGREDPLEKEMAIHSSTLAWKTGLQRVGHD